MATIAKDTTSATVIRCRHCTATYRRGILQGGDVVLECHNPRCRHTIALHTLIEPAGATFAAPSLTQAGAIYVVSGESCNCPAGRHGRRCWHVDAARWYRRVFTHPAPAAVYGRAA